MTLYFGVHHLRFILSKQSVRTRAETILHNGKTGVLGSLLIPSWVQSREKKRRTKAPADPETILALVHANKSERGWPFREEDSHLATQ